MKKSVVTLATRPSRAYCQILLSGHKCKLQFLMHAHVNVLQKQQESNTRGTTVGKYMYSQLQNFAGHELAKKGKKKLDSCKSGHTFSNLIWKL